MSGTQSPTHTSEVRWTLELERERVWRLLPSAAERHLVDRHSVVLIQVEAADAFSRKIKILSVFVCLFIQTAVAQADAAAWPGVKFGDWGARWIMDGDGRSEAGWIKDLSSNGINTL